MQCTGWGVSFWKNFEPTWCMCLGGRMKILIQAKRIAVLVDWNSFSHELGIAAADNDEICLLVLKSWKPVMPWPVSMSIPVCAIWNQKNWQYERMRVRNETVKVRFYANFNEHSKWGFGLWSHQIRWKGEFQSCSPALERVWDIAHCFLETGTSFICCRLSLFQKESTRKSFLCYLRFFSTRLTSQFGFDQCEWRITVQKVTPHPVLHRKL